MMVLKYANLLELFHSKESAKFVIKTKLDYVGMMVYQFLGTKVVINWKIKKKLQRLFKEYELEIKEENDVKIANYLDVALKVMKQAASCKHRQAVKTMQFD